MNINDIKKEDLEKEINEIKEKYGGDMLTSIFEAQKKLMIKYKEPKNISIDTREGQNKLRMEAMRIFEELGEALNCLKMKDWVKSEVLTDIDHFKEELGDFVHFTIEFFIMAGIDSKEFFELYFRKNLVNQFRIKSKY